MKLYGSPLSPFVRKVRILCHEKKVPFEFVIDDVWSADSIVPSKNPLGKVPALELENGELLFDSPLVMAWIDNHYGKPLVPADHDAYWRAMRWHTLANGMMDAVVARVVESRRPPDRQLERAREREEARVRRALESAEGTAKDGRYLVGGSFTIADLALGVALQYIDFRYPQDWRRHHPMLAQWHAAI